QPAAGPHRGRLEAAPVIRHREREQGRRARDRDRRLRGCRVLRDVLQSLETREVHGGLDVLRQPPDAVGVDPNREWRLPGLRVQRGPEALVGEQRRIDPARQVAKVVEGGLRLLLDLTEHLLRLGRVALHELPGEARLDGERDELLLCAVASEGQDTLGRSSGPTRSHTRATFAPAPSPRICAMRGTTSSVAYGPPTREENSVRTS